MDNLDMSWWKRAISESSVEAKLNKLYDQHAESLNGSNWDSAAPTTLARYVDGIPAARELAIRYMLASASGTATVPRWLDHYLYHISATGDVPSWFLKFINDHLDIGWYGNSPRFTGMEHLLHNIDPRKIDGALSKCLLRHGRIPPIFFDRDGQDDKIDIEHDMPMLYAAIVRTTKLNLRPGGLPQTSLQQSLDRSDSPPQQLTEALVEMVVATGCVPIFAYNWMERNLDKPDGGVSPEKLKEMKDGIISGFRRNQGICPPALPWFKKYLMTSRDDGLWRQIMFTILNPGAALRSTENLRNSLGSEIANARRNGVLADVYDDSVIRLVADYIRTCWSLGCDTAKPLDPWVFHYLGVAPIRERLRNSAREWTGVAMPSNYVDQKMDELEAHAKEME